MKAFKLREQNSFIKILKEPPLKKQKTNWSRYLYVLIIIAIVFYSVRKIYNANMVIFANGQIELPKQTISFAHDIQILEMTIQEGQSICQGDVLFYYNIIPSSDDQTKLNFHHDQPIDWIIKEELSLSNTIVSNNIKIKHLQDQIELINQNIKHKEKLLLLGLHREQNAYQNKRNEKSDLEHKIDAITQENQLLKNTKRQLQKSKSKYKLIEWENNTIYRTKHAFLSPDDGIISDIFYEANEICYRKDEMMTIHQMQDVSINTYFDPNEINYLKPGDSVQISFPDGSKSQGIIDKFFISTYALPSEFQKKYEPTERNIVAKIIPINKKDQQQWKNFYKMNVLVSKNRYYWSTSWFHKIREASVSIFS